MLKNLYLLGDIGYYNNNLKMCVNNIKNNINYHDALILLGDNFYPNGINNLDDKNILHYNYIFNGIKQPIYSILGNHDYLLNPKAQINHSKWIMYDFYYKKTYLNIDLYFIDTTQFYISNLVNKEKIENVHNNLINNLTYNQLNWLESEFKKDLHKPKIIIGHYPILTNGLYYNKMDKLYNLLIYLFRKYKIKAYISGHEHNIQFINQTLNNYSFKQIIVGSSSQNRTDTISNHQCLINSTNDENMYDNSDIFYGKISITNSNIFKMEYINKYNKVKYMYIL